MKSFEMWLEGFEGNHNNDISIRDALNGLTKKQLVEFALYCIKDVIHLNLNMRKYVSLLERYVERGKTDEKELEKIPRLGDDPISLSDYVHDAVYSASWIVLCHLIDAAHGYAIACCNSAITAYTYNLSNNHGGFFEIYEARRKKCLEFANSLKYKVRLTQRPDFKQLNKLLLDFDKLSPEEQEEKKGIILDFLRDNGFTDDGNHFIAKNNDLLYNLLKRNRIVW